MLENLRSMAVFTCVVDRGSFSNAARELGITTSAVSQQIRSLENELGVVLLHRSTRKISLTEAGAIFYQSCLEMVQAAERGKTRMNELRDELVGDLRIATTPELGAYHIVPALSSWLAAHPQLSINFEADNRYIDMIQERIDIAIRMSPALSDSSLIARPMCRVEQVLVATPAYLRQYPALHHPTDLTGHSLIGINLIKDVNTLMFKHHQTEEPVTITMPSRLESNNVFLSKTLCLGNHGITRILFLDVQKELARGELVEILPQWKLPDYTLYAVTLRREHQPIKITRCLESLSQYFSQIPGGRDYL